MMTSTPQLLRAALPLKQLDAAQLTIEILTSESAQHATSYPLLVEAISLASWAHRDDFRRSRGVMPKTHYIEHPLRNAVRLLRLGVTDISIIVAAILHDVVEDHADDIVRELLGYSDMFELERARVREFAFVYIERIFALDVADIVRGLSNPLSAPGRSRAQKNGDYADHVFVATLDPRVLLNKASDLADNALSLGHTVDDMDMVRRLTVKYRPALHIVISRLRSGAADAYLTPANREAFIDQLERGSEKLLRWITIPQVKD